MILKLELKLPNEHFDESTLHGEDESDILRETVADAYNISVDDVKITGIDHETKEHERN